MPPRPDALQSTRHLALLATIAAAGDRAARRSKNRGQLNVDDRLP
jgi:hypothetical protein